MLLIFRKEEWLITIKELEIIIKDNVEEVTNKIKKQIPQIKQQIKGVTDTVKQVIGQISVKSIIDKAQQAISSVKKKLQSLKAINKSNDLKIKVNNEDAKKQITQIKKEIDSLKAKQERRRIKLRIVNSELEQIKGEEIQKVGGNPKSNKTKKQVEDNLAKNKRYNELARRKTKITNESRIFGEEIESKEGKIDKLEGNNTFTKVKEKVGQIKGFTDKIKEGFGKVLNPIKSMGIGLKNGAVNLMKYIGSFISLRTIYSTLKSAADAWLSSQNAEAQQLSANIDYMKTAMGSVFAPVITFVTNLVYQLMKAVQSLVYAFTGVNIFAKATATSMNKTAGGASKASKSLSGIHSEINNVSSNEGGGGDGGGSPGTNLDLLQVDSQMNPIAEKLYDFFSPLVESWNNYGAGLIEQVKTTAMQIGGLISSVWGSFEKIITNGTVYSILQNIFGIIGNIAEAFSNAWNHNGNGDEIIQNTADAFNNVLDIINQIVQSTVFQWILEVGVGAFEKLTGAIEFVTEKLNEFVGFFIEENSEKIDGWAIIIGSIAAAIGILCGAILIFNVVTGIAVAVIGLVTSPVTLVILAITALIAIIVAVVVYWDEISAALAAGWEWIKQKAIEIFNAIGEFLSNLWQGICNMVMNLWNGICEFLSNLWNGIKDTASAIFNGIKDAISTAFNTVKDRVSDIWNNIVEGISNAWNNIITKVKEGVSGAWNAITSVFGNITGWFRDKFTQAWSAVKNVFSAGGKIFDGIKDGIVNAFKSVVNAIIRGINKVISIPFNAINGVLSGIRNISIAGIEPFTWIHTFNVPQIPELATGNVAYERTLAMFGEYSGANSNPEITTPQNIMRETFNEVLENHEWNNNKQPVRVQIYWGTKAVVDEIIDGINEKTRQTGKAQIKVAYS